MLFLLASEHRDDQASTWEKCLPTPSEWSSVWEVNRRVRSFHAHTSHMHRLWFLVTTFLLVLGEGPTKLTCSAQFRSEKNCRHKMLFFCVCVCRNVSLPKYVVLHHFHRVVFQLVKSTKYLKETSACKMCLWTLSFERHKHYRDA